MSGPISVVFMGTPDFAVPTLRALIEDKRFTVASVVTQPDKPRGRGRKVAGSPVKQLALENGLTILQPVSAGQNDNVEKLKSLKPDYSVVVAYGQILPPSVLAIPEIASVNLHASLLPAYRGAAPIHRAFLDGVTITGVCAMLMAEGLDTGDVLLCRKTEITDEDTAERLHDRLASIGAALMTETLIDFKKGSITPIKQDEELATYAKKLDKSELKVDWSQAAEAVSRRIRGLSPFPGAATLINGKVVKPLFAKAYTDETGEAPGVVRLLAKEGIHVACGQGSIIITELKPEGKGAMSAHAYTLGHKIKVGDKFG